MSDFSRNVYSQAGEDGILQAVFDRIGIGTRVCVEFGAWDGLHLSNTAALWRSGWRAILIEAAHDRYASLVANTAGYDCLCVHHLVTADGEGALEPLLERHGQTVVPDLLVIDIDGDDYQVFAGLRSLRPRVVCCEYNPTIPPDMTLVGRPGDGFGCSARALVALAENKGYALVAMTSVNCVFVRTQDALAFQDLETRFEALFPSSHLTSVITSYDGRYALSREPPYGLTSPHSGRFMIGTATRIRHTPMEWLATWLAVSLRRVRAALRKRW